MQPLKNPKHEAFAQALATGITASQAYVQAGFAKANASGNARRLMEKEMIAARITFLQTQQAAGVRDALNIDPAWIKAQFLAIAQADANALVEVVVHSCRYCHGDRHKYQWIDADEFAQAHAAWRALSKAKRAVTREPSDLGGYAFLARNAPNPSCPRCNGAGRPEVIFHPSKGHPLFDGAKIGKHGIDVKIKDPQAALVNLARALGVYQNHQDEGTDAVTQIIAQFRALMTKRIPGGAGPVLNYEAKLKAGLLREQTGPWASGEKGDA